MTFLIAHGGLLLHLKANQKLGNPGLKITQVAGSSELQVDLPERVGSYVSEPLKVTEQEIEVLPKDTTFGRRQVSISRRLQCHRERGSNGE